jgi:peptide/nickel transport system substrate-binding protein
MLSKRTVLATFSLVIVLAMLAACGPTPEPQVIEKVVTQEVEKTVVETVVETVEVETVVTATAEPEMTEYNMEAVLAGEFKCPKKGGTLFYGTRSEVPAFDPQLGSSSAMRRSVFNQIFDQLITPPCKTCPTVQEGFQPYLATEWEVSEDGLTYTFKLREGVQFHDGAPFNSEAVKINIERIQNNDTALLHAAWKDVVVETPDDYTVVFKRPSVRATFMDDIANNWSSFISPALLAVDSSQEYVDLHPVGTGPYMFVEYVPYERIVLEPNPNWWGGEVCLDQIVMQPFPEEATRLLQLESGDFQAISRVPTEEVARLREEGYNFIVSKSCRVEGLFFNVSREGPTSDVKFREALQYAFDREAILSAIDATGEYFANSSWLSPEGWPFDADRAKEYAYDLDTARELLSAAGYEDTDGDGFVNDPQTGQNVELGLMVGQWQPFFGEVVQGQLMEAGIMTNLEVLEKVTFYDRLAAGDFDTQLLNSQSETCDPYDMFDDLRSDYYQNVAQLSDPKVDELTDKALQYADQEKRAEIYMELVEYIDPMLLAVFIGEKHPLDFEVTNPNLIHGFRQDRYRVIKLDQVWLEE